MGLALDEPREGNEVIQQGNLVFVIEKGFLAMAQPIRVELLDQGSETDLLGLEALKEQPGMEFHISCPVLENDCALADDPSLCHTSCRV